MSFAFEHAGNRPRSRRRCPARSPTTTCGGRQLGAASCFFRHFALLRRRQLHARTPRLREPDGDRLLGRSCAMFALADMMYFFADKFARLRGRRFAFPLSLVRAFYSFFLWHDTPPRKKQPPNRKGRKSRAAKMMKLAS